MPWLFLDTHEMGRVRVGLLSASGARIKEAEGRSIACLPLVEQVLGKKKAVLEGICVVQGPGSFSAVRTGVLDANLLARLWRLPLTGVDVADAQDVEALAKRLAENGLKKQAYVAPVYDAEPNITVPKPKVT